MSDLRDCILGKGQVFHQDIQTFVLFIQELPDPSVREIQTIRALLGMWNSLKSQEKLQTLSLSTQEEKKKDFFFKMFF